MTLATDEIKSCCAAAYGSPAARILLGASFHPGGVGLTRQLIRPLSLDERSVAVDVACGPGTSALELARETGCAVIGIDLSPANVAEAQRAADAAGLAKQISFLVGDAEALPLEDGSVDGALCECALCTFPDKRTAVRELARVLKPGARLALSDMTADIARLPDELCTVQAWVACIADARPLDEIAELLGDEGFAVESVDRHDDALVELLDRVAARLKVLAMTAALNPGDLERGSDLAALARNAVTAGTLGYGSLIASRR